jgi:hypothetical protein
LWSGETLRDAVPFLEHDQRPLTSGLFLPPRVLQATCNIAEQETPVHNTNLASYSTTEGFEDERLIDLHGFSVYGLYPHSALIANTKTHQDE